jgi:hypothetical protein
MRITVWICPTAGCGHYYASSTAGDLHGEFNTNSKGQPTFPRSRCPDCRRRTHQEVDRVPRTFELTAP